MSGWVFGWGVKRTNGVGVGGHISENLMHINEGWGGRYVGFMGGGIGSLDE